MKKASMKNIGYELMGFTSFNEVYSVGEYKGRRIRLNCNATIDIGECDKTFDRWANSTETTIYPKMGKIQAQLDKYLG